MENFIGIDLGTWMLRVVLMSEDNALIAEVSRPMKLSSPFPDWAEQSANDWWQELGLALDELAANHEVEMGHVRALCASGHAHALLALDERLEPLRPAILWNDLRSIRESAEIAELLSETPSVDTDLAPCLHTAARCLWLRRNEPAITGRISKLCFGIDWLTFKLGGKLLTNHTEPDLDGWLDGVSEHKNQEALQGWGIDMSWTPELATAGSVGGVLHSDLAKRWHMPPDAVIAVGCTDRAALMVGAGAVAPGTGILNIGISGVLAVCSKEPGSKAPAGLSKLPHALLQRTRLQSRRLLGTGGLRWISRLTGVERDEAYLDAAGLETIERMAAPLFIPFDATRRTRSAGKHESGTLIGVGEHTSSAQLAYAVQEGVAFEFRALVQACRASGVPLDRLSLIGDGARQSSWGELLANCLNVRVDTHLGSEFMAALGAARLARLAYGHEESAVSTAPPLQRQFVPQPNGRVASALNERHEHYLQARQFAQKISLPSTVL